MGDGAEVLRMRTQAGGAGEDALGLKIVQGVNRARSFF
ncbi:MAG: hypothetical protein OJF52_003942 [Nitrospira sp.]|jgi:hypothetical protein|nr:MAG: hypothetical protein OJF52_003942 [Nitrospira sp.]